MSTIDVQTLEPGRFPITIRVRDTHTLRGDVGPETGSDDSAPGPHD